MTDVAIVTARAQLTDSNLRLAELDLKAAEFAGREVELKQSQAQLKIKLADLRTQLRQLEVRTMQEELERARAAARRAAGLQEQADRVALLDEQGAVRSPYPGRVLEVATAAGQMLVAGGRLGEVEVEDAAGPPPRNRAYFPLAAGKRLQEGMPVRVTPTEVQRERFGSIVGRVVRVSPFPVTAEAAVAVVGNVEVLSGIARPGGMIEVQVELEADPAAAGRTPGVGRHQTGAVLRRQPDGQPQLPLGLQRPAAEPVPERTHPLRPELPVVHLDQGHVGHRQPRRTTARACTPGGRRRPAR